MYVMYSLLYEPYFTKAMEEGQNMKINIVLMEETLPLDRLETGDRSYGRDRVRQVGFMGWSPRFSFLSQ